VTTSQTPWAFSFPPRGPGAGLVNEREHLAQADRHIAQFKAYIACQQELIAAEHERGEPTELAVSMLRALEASLRRWRRTGSKSSPI
jgi:hypothetical protein